ncbi:MAG: 5-(carboxyamino)imidazole ribonucleotide mutase [bacterium]|nr:5-(carboxyamino)imidazole ribonucleotide mutase [bacterium]
MNPNLKPLVCIILGSLSNARTMAKAEKALTELGVPFETKAFSAHRTPDDVEETVDEAIKKGVLVFLVAAGMSAHLGGFVAARAKTLPVVAVPTSDGPLHGLDALLSTGQMPPGVPVATMPIDGAENAAIFAAQILGISSERFQIVEALEKRRDNLAEKVRDGNRELQRCGSLANYIEAHPS